MAVAVVLAAVVGTRTGSSPGAPFLTWGRQPAVASTTAAALARGRWSSIPPGPMTDITDAVWTGSRLVALGERNPFAGYWPASQAAGPVGLEMAEYDPSGRRWRSLPPPPSGGTLLWTGRLVLLWSPDGAGHRFDPRTGRWTPMAPAPPAARSYQTATALWTGRQMIVVAGGVRPPDTATSPTDPSRYTRDQASPDAAAYDPATDRWHALPAAPEHHGRRILSVTAVWAGDRLVEWWEWDHVVLNHSNGGLGFDAHTGIETATYDPRANRWSRPEQLEPGGPSGVGQALWTGKEVVLPSAGTFFAQGPVAYAGDPGPSGPGYVYDITHRSYAEMTKPPWYVTPGSDSLWVGQALLELSEGTQATAGHYPVIVAAWDASTNRWAVARPSPPMDQLPNIMVWTGRELVTFTHPSLDAVNGRDLQIPMTAMSFIPG